MPSKFIPLEARMEQPNQGESSSHSPHHLANADSSDEYDGHIIQKEEFRIGFPLPLPRHPIIYTAVAYGPHIEVWRRCQQLTIGICKDVGLSVTEISVSMIQGAKESIPSPTIQIIAESENQRELWTSVLTLISRMLRDPKLARSSRTNSVPEILHQESYLRYGGTPPTRANLATEASQNCDLDNQLISARY